MQKQTQQLMLMLVIGVLIGTFTMLIFRAKTPDDQRDTATQQEETVKTLASTSTESIGPLSGLLSIPEIPRNVRVGISTSDQPAGMNVEVKGLTITDQKWVAVYDDRDGHPAWILGASRVHPGDTTVTVPLLRGTTAGSRYYTAILNDDGDDSFNRLTDLPPFTPENITIVSFMAQ